MLYSCIIIACFSLLICGAIKPPNIEMIEPFNAQFDSWKTFHSRINSYNIRKGDKIHLVCKGIQLVEWKSPEIRKRNYSQRHIQINGNCTFGQKDELCSQLIFGNVSYQQTGFYACYYKKMMKSVHSIYIFINDTEHYQSIMEKNPLEIRPIEPSHLSRNSWKQSIYGNNYTDIPEGSKIRLKCVGALPIKWMYFMNIGFDYKGFKKETRIISSCQSNENQMNITDGSRCSSELIIDRTTYEMTGNYTCFYNDFPYILKSLYYFINSHRYLLLSHKSYVLFNRSESLTIPCLSSNSKTNVILLKNVVQINPKKFTNITFDSTIGFFVDQITNIVTLGATNILHCVVNKPNSEIPVDFRRLDLMTSISINLEIIKSISLATHSETNKLFRVGESFYLHCPVKTEISSIFGASWAWSFPELRSRFDLDSEFHDDRIEEEENKIYVYKARIEDEGYYSFNVFLFNQLYSKQCYITIYDKVSISFSTPENGSHLCGHENDNIELIVNIKVIPHVSHAVLSWHKDSHRLLNMTISYMESININYTQDLNKYEANFDSEMSHVILNVKNIKSDDMGVYTLVGDSLDMTTNISIFVGIAGPPKLNIIETLEFFSPYESHNLTCSVLSNQLPIISWYFFKCQSFACESYEATKGVEKSDINKIKSLDDQSIKKSVNNVISNQIKTAKCKPKGGIYSIVSIIKITKSETSGIYRCFASNSNGFNYADKRFIVTTAGSEGFRLDVNSSEIVEGDDILLTCQATTSIYFKLVWLIESPQTVLNSFNKSYPIKLLSTPSVQIRSQTMVHSTLEIKLLLLNVNLTSSSTYYCEAANRFIYPDVIPVKMKEIKIKVEPLIACNITQTNLNGDSIQINSLVTYELYCYTSGKPKPIVEWFKDGRSLVTDELNIGLLSNNQLLVIHAVNQNASGLYQCKVYNRGGTIYRNKTLEIVQNTNNNDVRLSNTTIAVAVFFVILIMVLIAITVNLLIRINRQEQIAFFTSNLFNSSSDYTFNPELPLQEQVTLLSYDDRFEFPADRLKLLNILGEGAFGQVRLARAIGLSTKTVQSQNYDQFTKLVAVKMLKANADTMQKRALIDELKIMIHLGRHLNIVNCLGAVTKYIDRGKLMIIIEYCSNGNLKDFLMKQREFFVDQIDPLTTQIDKKICRKPIYHMKSGHPMGDSPSSPFYADISNKSVDQIDSHIYENVTKNSKMIEEDKSISTSDLVGFAFQVARGMDYLQQKKLIHRDLAARNILVTEQKILKICDFGLARDIQQEYKTKGITRLPVKWMAIESIGDQVFTSKSDVWSFGVLLWEIFSLGKTPYPGIQVDRKFYSLLLHGYRMDRPDRCPLDIYHIMRDCWKSQPIERPDFEHLIDKLSKMMDETIVNYYLVLNSPYEEVNKELTSEDECIDQTRYVPMISFLQGYQVMNPMERQMNKLENYYHNASNNSLRI